MVTRVQFNDGDVLHLLPGETLEPATQRQVVKQVTLSLAQARKDLSKDRYSSK